MDLQRFTSSPGTWEFSLDAWKRAQDLGSVSVRHSIAADRLEYYLKDKAAVALEREVGIADQAPPSTELCPRERGIRRGPTTPAQYVEGGLVLLHWDLTEYLWSLENLAEDLWPAWTWSSCCFGASALAKALQLYFWPSPEHATAGSVLTTALAIYHGGWALAYLSSLYLVSRCNQQASELKHKATEELQRVRRGLHPRVGEGNIGEDEVRAWGGRMYAIVDWVANQRNFRTWLFEGPASLVWIVDFVVHWVAF